MKRAPLIAFTLFAVACSSSGGADENASPDAIVLDEEKGERLVFTAPKPRGRGFIVRTEVIGDGSDRCLWRLNIYEGGFVPIGCRYGRRPDIDLHESLAFVGAAQSHPAWSAEAKRSSVLTS